MNESITSSTLFAQERLVIDQDQHTIRLHKLVRSSQSEIDLEQLRNELYIMQKTRKSKYLQNHVQSPMHVAEALAQNQALRSRCTEILITISRWASQIQRNYELLIHYLSAKYDKQIPGKSKDERMAFIKYQLTNVEICISELTSIRDIAKFVLEDIDASQWSLKSLIETYKLKTHHEVNF
jgi:hypothetical protein